MDDPVAFLMNRGMPLDAIQKLCDKGISIDESAAAIERMLSRGCTMADILEMDGVEVPEEITDKPTLSTISALDLQQKNIPPIRWIVKDLIPAGLIIVASPPKFGKSWMAMNLCLEVAAGGTFLGYECCKAGCLYLALEDSERRLKSRMLKVLHPAPAPESFDFTTTAPTLGDGLIDSLEAYIRQNQKTGLIIIDTLQKVRNLGSGRDVYGKDYSDVGALKKFADAHNIAVVVIHHLRKMTDDSDPFNRISGSNGITGAADTMMVLSKEKRSEDAATLSITGRDVEQNDLALKFNKTSCVWENMGNLDAFEERRSRFEYAENPIVRTIKKLLDQSSNYTWTGTSQQLLDAGHFIAKTTLADTARALSSKFNELDRLLLEYDGIGHERKPNGNGGRKHRFYYVDAPKYEELQQTELTPFDGQPLL